MALHDIHIDKLQPHPRNTEIYGIEDVSALAARIFVSNWIKPLVVTPEHRIVSGHRRWLAAKSLNFSTVPVEYRTFTSEEDELEALLLENENRDKTVSQKTREALVWEEIEKERARKRQQLAGEMFGRGQEKLVPNLAQAIESEEAGKSRDKAAAKVGMKRSSYDKSKKVVAKADELRAEGKEKEAKQLIETLDKKSVNLAYNQIAKQEAAEARANAPTPILPPQCHVHHADSTECIHDNSIDLILTDPPYNLGAYSGVTKIGDQIVSANFDGDDEWDSVETEAFKSKLWDWIEEWERVLKPGGAVITFMDRAMVSHVWDFMKRVGLRPKNTITWVKTNPSPAALARRNLISATEYLVWAVKPGDSYTFNDVEGWNRHNVITTPIIGGNEKVDHPTQKPLSVLTKLIACMSNQEDVILDPFSGSGSTGVAAIQLHRHVHLIEKDLNYIRIAQERIAALSQEIAA